jgi:protein-S-isoprenylcysteine O-methyltransferase Ste14
MLLARIWELQHKFRAQPGRVVERRSFKLLVAVGMAAVILCALDYARRGAPPRHLWLSVAGVVIGLCACVLRAWSRRALDLMWSLHVEIRENHTLVQTGPYARFRHPVYLATMMEGVAAMFLFNAWIPGLAGLAAMAFILWHRVEIEERAMEEKFGDAWRQHRLRAGWCWLWP